MHIYLRSYIPWQIIPGCDQKFLRGHLNSSCCHYAAGHCFTPDSPPASHSLCSLAGLHHNFACYLTPGSPLAPHALAVRSLGPLFLGGPVRSARLQACLKDTRQESDGPLWLFIVLSCIMWLAVAVPFARLHSSTILGASAVGALFWCVHELVYFESLGDAS